MYSGVGSYPSSLYRTYVLLNWSIFIFLVVYGFYVANFLAIRWADPVGDRWTTFVWWRIAATASSILPAWFLHQLMYHNAIRLYYTIHLWVSIIVGGIDGVSLAFLIVDWVNCENVAYCVHPDNPAATDISFFFLFCGLAAMLFVIILWLVFNRYLLERTEIRMVLNYYSNENRPAFGMTPMTTNYYDQTIPSGSNIGANADYVQIPVMDDETNENMTAETRGLYEAIRALPRKLRLEAIIPLNPCSERDSRSTQKGQFSASSTAVNSQTHGAEEERIMLKMGQMKWVNNT